MENDNREIVKILHHRSNPIDYRPHAQHVLYNNDEHFENKYCALQYYVNKYNNYYNNTILNCNNSLIDKITSDIINSLSFSTIDLLPISLISSNYSIIDKSKLLNHLTNQINNILSNQVIVITYRNEYYNKINCVNDILINIYDLIIYQIDNKIYDNRQKKTQINNNIKKISNKAMYLPDLAIQTLINDYNDCINQSSQLLLVIILPDINIHSNEMLSELIDSLYQLDVNIHLIALQCNYIETPIHRLTKAISLSNIKHYQTNENDFMYEHYMNQILSDHTNSIYIPIQLLGLVHEEYFRSHRCVNTVNERYISCLIDHFSHRRSLLGIFQETEWLKEMKLIPNNKSNRRDDITYSVDQLLSYLDGNDISGTDLILAVSSSTSSSTIDRSNEVKHAETLLYSACFNKFVHRLIFKCLKLIRDNLLDAKSANEYSNVLIWAGIIQDQIKSIKIIKKSLNNNKRKLTTIQSSKSLNILSDLFNHINESIVSIPFNTIKLTVKDISTYFHDLTDQILGYDYNKPLIDDIRSNIDNYLNDLNLLIDFLFSGWFTDLSTDLSINQMEIVDIDIKDVSVPIDPLSTPPPISLSNMNKHNELVVFIKRCRGVSNDAIKYILSILLELSKIPSRSMMPGILEFNNDESIKCFESSNGLIRRNTIDGIINSNNYLTTLNSNNNIDMSILTKKICTLSDKISSFELFEYFKELSTDWNIKDSDHKKLKSKKLGASLVIDNDHILWQRYVLALDNLHRTGLCTIHSTKVGDNQAAYVIRNIFTFTDNN